MSELPPGWRAILRGEQTTLQLLSEAFSEPDCLIVQEGDGFVLTTSSFNDLDDAREVKSAAQEIAQRLSGCAQLMMGWHSEVSVSGVYRIDADGKHHAFIFPDPCTVVVRGYPATLTLQRQDGSVETQLPASPARRWIEAAEADPRVARALRLLSKRSLTWADVYRLVETVQSAVEEETLQRWSSKKQRQRLMHTANSITAVGDEARHGVERTAPPPQPMPIEEARKIAKLLVEQWLRTI